MSRIPIPLDQLALAPFGQWNKNWFLLTAGENHPRGFNAMTVSWGSLGFLWDRPMAMVVVRPTRHTYQFMEKFDSFSLCSFPEKHRPVLLEVFGRKSGRDLDKAATAGLTPIGLTQIASPGYAEADLILECRKMYFGDFDPKHFLADFIAPHYQNDFHRFYLGEVVAAQGTPAYALTKSPA